MRAIQLIYALTFLLAADRAYPQCGVERWGVKTLTDNHAAEINWTESNSSVAYQNQLPRPFTTGWASKPRQNNEDSTYAITAIIIGLGLEDDGDYHLILRDLHSADTMVAEIPDPNCAEIAVTAKASEYQSARNQIDALFGAPMYAAHFLLASKYRRVTIHGVGFWEKRNHGTGHAVNGREIHPVFKIEIVR